MSAESTVDSTPGEGPPPAGPILGFSRRVNGLVHWIAGAAVTALMFWTVIDVVGRRFFNQPLRGTVELTELAMVVVIYLGFAYAENLGDHVSVDLLYTKLGRLAQLAITILVSTYGIVIVGLLTYYLAGYAEVLTGGGRTTPTRDIPLGPVAWVAVGGSALFTVALVDTAVSSVRRFRERN